MTVLLSLALVLFCALALLAVPVEIAFTLHRRETFHGSLSIGWLFGAVRAPVPLPGSKPPAARRRRKKKGGGRDRRRRVVALVRSRSFRRRLVRGCKDLCRATRVSGLTLRARVGLDDPADTGLLWGAVGPLSVLLAGMRGAVIRVEPDFAGEAFELDSSGKIRIIPLTFFFIVVAFLLSPITVKTIWVSR